jgi:predicted nicotinamide N-methyase
MVFITIQVPPNVEAGIDTLTFEYGGNELEIIVPPGSVAGDFLQIQVGGVDESDGERVNNDETTDAVDTEEGSSGLISMPLGDGGILHIYDSINNNQTIMASSNNDDGEDGTNRMIWAAGRVLAQALTSSFGLQLLNDLLLTPYSAANATIDQLNCLELGSGLGVCGLALAHALNSIGRESDNSLLEHSIIANILLTDRGEDTVQLLRKNIQSNHPANNDQDTTTTAELLVWGNTIQHKNNNKGSDTKYHIIIGSDLLYNTQESYIPLLTTIQQHCHEEGIVLLAVRWRKPDLECQFFELAESNYGLLFELWNEFTTDTTFGGGRCPCLLHWKEYGNPKSELLHIFLTETKVNAGGEEMSLGQVTEKDMEVMTDEEYTIFEELQIQIYVGRYNDGKTTFFPKMTKEGRLI